MGMFDKVKNNSIVSKAKEIDKKNKIEKQKKIDMRKTRSLRKDEIKEGEKIIKNIMGTTIVRNTKFNLRIINQGVPATKVMSVWSKINKQVKNEVYEGTLQNKDIPMRIGQLLAENGDPTKVQQRIQENTVKMETKQKKLGVEGYNFSCTLHEKRMGTFGGKKEDVIKGYCYVKEDRLVIKKISIIMKTQMGDKVIPYSKINAIDFDKAGKFHITSSIVISVSGFDTVILKDTNEQNFKLLHDTWIRFNTKSNQPTPTTTKVIEKSTSTNADELLKYAELYEKGLLTKEEFDLKKKELL